MDYRDIATKIATSSLGSKIIKAVIAPLDPLVYRLTGGRFTAAGPQVVPQLILTTTGRKSGKRRSVQLAYTPIDGVPVIVGSNFGGEHHPAWSYNLAARPECEVNLDGDVYTATAVQLSPEERARIWDQLCENVGAYRIYVQRTARDIKVYRLERQG